jgi:hypothetical protein
MSNGYKFRRVAHVFGVHLHDIIVTKQSRFCFFLTVVRFILDSVFTSPR